MSARDIVRWDQKAIKQSDYFNSTLVALKVCTQTRTINPGLCLCSLVSAYRARAPNRRFRRQCPTSIKPSCPPIAATTPTHHPPPTSSSSPPAPLLHREQILCSGHIAPRGDLDLCATAAAPTTTTTSTSTSTTTTTTTTSIRTREQSGCVNAQSFCASWDLPQPAASISLTSYGLQPPQSNKASPPPALHGRPSAFLSHPAWSRT